MLGNILFNTIYGWKMTVKIFAVMDYKNRILGLPYFERKDAESFKRIIDGSEANESNVIVTLTVQPPNGYNCKVIKKKNNENR